MSSPTSTRGGQLPSWAIPAFKWLSIVNALLVVLQAFLASEGFWGNSRSLVARHGEIGNVVFLTFVAQAVLAVMLVNAGVLPRFVLFLAGLMVLLIFAQIGLGYSTRDNFKITAYHVTNGVLLMGVTTVLATIAWVRGSDPGRA